RGRQRPQVFFQRLVALHAERAGELGLVDVAISRQVAGAFDDGVGLAAGVARRLLRFLFALFVLLVLDRDRLQQHQDVVLATLVVDLLNERELVFRRIALVGFVGREELHGVGAEALDL